jgi:transcriptional regulator with XRE-family HTH domain
MSVGENIKRLREAAGLSQTGLARRAGIDQGGLSKIEKGRNLTLETLRDLARALGCSVVDLLEEGDKHPKRAA